MLAYQNPDFNVEVSEVVATEGVPSTLPTPSGNGGLPIPLRQGGIAVAIIFALTLLLKTTIESITKLVKEAKDD
ncbi:MULTISPECIES: hypothetical protein [Moorena]|uniref:Uncharacterized protein n=1 Tax=Moorena producens (strain JHB) TaxID=1454205 RepID=A0A1D9G8T4_MOOP1|nr:MULTISPECIES: hypothetical protein [Moorena]AOY84013.1 hypothetical protein BJP36_32895 [Moorena producens JHB]NEQ17270.1 hypothetical protein [Moorena sp. SIO3E2]NER91810.1 hypothetical protein [Moorena sp. SIO3A2]